MPLRLFNWIRASGVSSIAIPQLGCGLGGLEWEAVGAEIVHTLGDLPGVDVRVYGPAVASGRLDA